MLKPVEKRVLCWLKTRDQELRTAIELYGAIVTQARQPAFFAGMGIADTPEGRCEMIILHLVLVLERLRREGAKGEQLARLAVETFVTDVDDSLREMGVGDMAVPKKVRRAAVGLYERSAAYRRALALGDEPLARELAAAIPGLDVAPEKARLLAAYVRRTARHLGTVTRSDILGGKVTFATAPA
jgi:cytochrome b pre-mRNA-processing protein 3